MPTIKVIQMGDRNNIILKYGEERDIYFYTHWGGSKMKEDLKNALIRGKDRWDDEPYLARIIFSELVKEDILGLTGYGISPYECDQDSSNTRLVVDLIKQTVNGIKYEDFVED